jgi:hypothetical protein
MRWSSSWRPRRRRRPRLGSTRWTSAGGRLSTTSRWTSGNRSRRAWSRPPGARPSSRLLARRDHLGLAALDARLDARRLRTTIGGGARLPGSPGIPVEFLAEPSFVRAAPTISGPSGLGGTAPLAIRFADQRRHGDARASLGPHGRVAAVAAEALEPGELAMTFGGVVERRPAADGAGGPSFVGQALWATELNVEQTPRAPDRAPRWQRRRRRGLLGRRGDHPAQRRRAARADGGADRLAV